MKTESTRSAKLNRRAFLQSSAAGLAGLAVLKSPGFTAELAGPKKRVGLIGTGWYGKVDLLVNNAGITRFVPHDDLDALDDELIDRIFRVNWRGAFAAIRAFRALLARDGGGLVVNISSTGGISGIGSNVAYCASKAAMNVMTKSLARALAPDIRVLAIAPALVEGAYAASFDPEWRRAQLEQAPMGRLVTAEDVANAVLAATSLLTFSTGSVIVVDGGRLLN